jgi:hypothetical protein
LPKRKVRLGKASFQIAGGKTETVEIRLSRKNRRLLARLERVRVLATVRARDQAGNTATRTRTLTLIARPR